MAKKINTKLGACEAVAKSLRDFGYPDVTRYMISEILDAYLDGKRGEKLPHGVIGVFAESQFDEIEEARPGTLKALA